MENQIMKSIDFNNLVEGVYLINDEVFKITEVTECNLSGDTKPLKEVLKKLGGKFNSRLNIPCKCGWIFPKTSEATIRLFLNIDRAM